MDNTKTVYVNVRMIIDEHADAQEVVDNCDYWFQHKDDIKRCRLSSESLARKTLQSKKL
jgi:hypothetical protein